MSDQYPQYQPPAGDGSRPQPDQPGRFETFGQAPTHGDHAADQPAWTPDPGYQYQQQSTPPPPPPYAPSGQPWTPPPTQVNDVAASAKGFLGALFDFSFSTFITPKIIKAVYIVVTALIGLAAVGFLLSAVISGEPGIILMALIGVPLAAIVYLALARMTLELYFAVVRLSEDVHERLPRQ